MQRPSSYSASPPFFANQGGAMPPPPVPLRKKPSDLGTKASKLNQIIQQFYCKAAHVVFQSRTTTTPVNPRGPVPTKTNKWFALELEDTDAYREELQFWRYAEASATSEAPIPPLVIDVVLDVRDLTPSETLLLVDDSGRRIQVDALGTGRGRKTEIVLERWTVDLRGPPPASPPELPVVYKKSIVLFRSMYMHTRLLATYKLRKRLQKAKVGNTLKIACRVYAEQADMNRRSVPLETPISSRDSRKELEEFSFGKVDTPAGSFHVNVAYRTSCDFRVDDSEALLSSHFIDMDEDYFRPAAPIPEKQGTPSSLPSTTSGSTGASQAEPGTTHAYGSLSSLRRPTPQHTSSLRGTRAVTGSFGDRSKSSLRSHDGDAAAIPRRPSVTFIQPFKSPTLSASPIPAEQQPQRASFTITRTGSRNSVSAPPVGSVGASGSSLRSITTPSLPTAEVHPVRPPSVPRYSSSFGERRKGSFASRRRPSILDDAGRTSSSSGGMPSVTAPAEEHDGLDEFLKMVDERKPLQSSIMAASAQEAPAIRTRTSVLSKFQKMKDSHAALTDSLTVSLMLQRPSSTPGSGSSRHIGNVPAMVSGASYSSSSSPGNRLSPHTPIIPSKLSEGSTIHHYSQRRRHESPRVEEEEEEEEDVAGPSASPLREHRHASAATTSPLDIPSSPMPFRLPRSSSFTQRVNSGVIVDGDTTSAGRYGAKRRPSNSLGSIDQVQPDESLFATSARDVITATPITELETETTESQNVGVTEDSSQNVSSTSLFSRGNSHRFAARGRFGSSSTLSHDHAHHHHTHGARRGSTSSAARTSNRGFSLAVDDDELLFAMSDMSVMGHKRPSSTEKVNLEGLPEHES
ncbi:hypothetical protein SAICODRAFT_86527 [Saitoella complicata NRRL Y-17804]|uniref:uncharacterized protein n=1 Tax=Saitoella complicata (strain BCRC 22490 / CBS 7301 / JCM 7358 / NBRC 10748 / NRRL Y-17804) TaxID=698492 RepID=UPI000866ABE2|nr:uncharacterized protein SAICODRAFT_86527 [Saitoella complicata NRRL Y-17804]ODQ56024.1 hypothetical protein SAICODRAFT_86527 [Saitoella complicata NRRL Y-17804]